LASDNSQRRDDIERRQEEAFRQEAEALRGTLVHYMTGELSDGQLKEAAQQVIRESFKDLVQQTLGQGELHRRIATDLASALLTGLRQSIPDLQAQALQGIQADLERKWTEQLPKLTQDALQRVVDQKLVPQNLPEILRRSLTEAFARHDSELKREITSQRQLQEAALRKELNEQWRSSLPAVLEQSLGQAVSGHLSQEALQVQVEKVVSRYLQGLELEIRQRLDLSQTIGVRQEAELNRVRSDIESRWKEALPGMVLEGLNAALPQALGAKALADRIATRIDEVVAQRIAAIEDRLRQELNVQQRIQTGQQQWDTTARQLLTDHWNDVLPDMLKTSFENALLDHLTHETLDERLRTLIDERLKVHLSAPPKQETPQEPKAPPLLPEKKDEKGEPKPSPLPRPPSPGGDTGAEKPKEALWRMLTKPGDLRARWAQRPHAKREARWAAALVLLLLGLAYYLVFVRRSGETTTAGQTPPPASVTIAPSVTPSPAPTPQSVVVEDPWKNPWKIWMQEQGPALTQLSRRSLDDLYTCWYKGKEVPLQQLWDQVEKKQAVDPEALKKAFPDCASQETPYEVAVLSAQLAVKKALGDAEIQKGCPNQKVAETTAFSLRPDGGFGKDTRKAFKLFLRCSQIDPSVLPEKPTNLDHLFLVYIALRKAHPVKNG
jgi:hypothetical protein